VAEVQRQGFKRALAAGVKMVYGTDSGVYPHGAGGADEQWCEQARPGGGICLADHGDGGEGQRWLAARAPWLAEMKPIGGRATAFVCEEFACQAPVNEAADLRRLLGG
jgi:hypothetical protein